MNKTTLLATLLCAAVACRCGAGRAEEPAHEIRLADLLKLPYDNRDDYRVDPYLKIAQSLQAMGSEKACVC